MAASTQNQAKSALLFLFKEVLGMELPWLDEVAQTKAPKRLPVVLTRAEVGQMMAGVPHGPLDGLLRAAPERGLHVEEPVLAYGMPPRPLVHAINILVMA